MGKRSRKRARPAAERVVEPPPERPPVASPPRAKRGRDDLPPPPWSPFPLVELCVLAALVIGAIGFFGDGRRSAILLACAATLGSLAGLEITIREHLAGFRSHTTVLALAVAVGAMAIAFFAGAPQLAIVAIGAPLFVTAFWLLRGAFQRKSGGYSVR
jgi:hypothetical protein